MREIIETTSEAHWLRERSADITSTEAAALFGCSPYATEFELYHRKTGQLEDSFQENDRTRWGNRLEAAIAYGVAEDLGLIVQPKKHYMRITELRMGSSFDFEVVGLREDWSGDDETYRDLFRTGKGVLVEVKNVDGMAFRRGWIAGEEIEAPPHIELQVQHQLEVSDYEYAIVAPLIGGNTPQPFYRKRDRDIGEAIKAKVTEFWQRVDANNPPPPDFEADANAISRLYVNSNNNTVDMTDNDYLATLCAEYKVAGDDEKEAKTRKDALKAEILTIIGDAGKALVAGFTISAGTVAENPGKIITETMVGERVGGRRSYRNMRITAKSA